MSKLHLVRICEFECKRWAQEFGVTSQALPSVEGRAGRELATAFTGSRVLWNAMQTAWRSLGSRMTQGFPLGMSFSPAVWFHDNIGQPPACTTVVSLNSVKMSC